MTITRRIFISSPRDQYLTPEQIKLKHAIINEIESSGTNNPESTYEAQIFGTDDFGKGLTAGITWSPADAEEVMRRCVGAVIIGLPIWKFSGINQSILLVTEYCHYEGALARTLKLPILALLEKGAVERGFFVPHAGNPFLYIPKGADDTWVKEKDGQFQKFLGNWKKRLDIRRDIFLGYSSLSIKRAQQIKSYLNTINITVWDWYSDFAPGPSILDRIQEAERLCTAGIFLFTRDDIIQSPKSEIESALPRDNVVFEAGYFMHAKSKNRVFIIREEGSKMPADLGGIIYASLTEGSELLPDLKNSINNFVKQQL